MQSMGFKDLTMPRTQRNAIPQSSQLNSELVQVTSRSRYRANT